MLKTGRFNSVVITKTPTDKGVIVTITVAEKPLVEKIIFSGNRCFKDQELAKELPFGQYDALDPSMVEAGAQVIRNKYAAEGYPSVEVKVSQAERRVTYSIVEGPQSIVTKISFKGNKYFHSWQLRWKVSSWSRHWPFVKGQLDVEKADKDVLTVREAYISEGFLDVLVEKQLQFSADKKVSYGEVVAIMDAARAAGIHNVTAFTKKSVK